MSKSKPEQSSLKMLKSKNRWDVLEVLRHTDKPLSVLDVSRRTALSKMTVHTIMLHLANSGLILNMGKREPGEDGGKRPSVFMFNPGYRFIFSAKIGETSLMTAVTDLKAQILATQTAVYDRDCSLVEILRVIRNHLHTLAAKLSLRADNCVGVVIGCHGITDSEKGVIVTSPHFSSWGANIPIRERVKELFAFEVPVHVDNWIRFFAYSEMKTSHRQGFMVIGTEFEGIAAGLVIDGRLISGARGLSGEIGHMIVQPDSSEVCVCGGIGCLEVAVSLRRMERRAWLKREEWPESLLFRGRPRQVSYAMIFDAANAGDVLACTLLDEAVGHFAIAINNITQVCDPGLVIIQGEYAKAGAYFLNRLRERLEHMSLLRMNKGVRVEYSGYTDEWTLAGGAHFVSDRFFANFSV